MGNLLQCSCMKDNENNTQIKLSSTCFKKDIKIVLHDDDDDALEIFNAIEDILKGVQRKKTLLKERKESQKFNEVYNNDKIINI